MSGRGLAVECLRELSAELLDQHIGVALLTQAAVTHMSQARQRPNVCPQRSVIPKTLCKLAIAQSRPCTETLFVLQNLLLLKPRCLQPQPMYRSPLRNRLTSSRDSRIGTTSGVSEKTVPAAESVRPLSKGFRRGLCVATGAGGHPGSVVASVTSEPVPCESWPLRVRGRVIDSLHLCGRAESGTSGT